MVSYYCDVSYVVSIPAIGETANWYPLSNCLLGIKTSTIWPPTVYLRTPLTGDAADRHYGRSGEVWKRIPDYPCSPKMCSNTTQELTQVTQVTSILVVFGWRRKLRRITKRFPGSWPRTLLCTLYGDPSVIRREWSASPAMAIIHIRFSPATTVIVANRSMAYSLVRPVRCCAASGLAP